MRLDYHVLCIDDDIETLQETKRLLSAHNEQVGIQTNFIDIEAKPAAREVDAEQFKDRIFKEIRGAFEHVSFDMIMVDLHLGATDSPMGFKGHEIISFIRGSQTMYRPIVFYSSGEPKGDETAVNQLEDGLRDNNLIGKSIFVSSRGNSLNLHLAGICSEMHTEEHKLNASRGLLMDRTSEIDAMILNHLRRKETWERLDQEQLEILGKEVLKEIKRLRKNAIKVSCNLRELSRSSLAEFSKWICEGDAKEVVFGLNAFSRNIIMREWMRVHTGLKNQGDLHSGYFKPSGDHVHLSSIRDKYAHQTEEQIGTEHNDERCKYIRDELRKHLSNITQVTSS